MPPRLHGHAQRDAEVLTSSTWLGSNVYSEQRRNMNIKSQSGKLAIYGTHELLDFALFTVTTTVAVERLSFVNKYNSF
jgi:hypothetical protein